jgi:hypothetical protein
MSRSRQRPVVVATVLGWVAIRAVMVAGVFTAILATAVHAAAPICIAALVVLTLLIGAIDMRESAPDWFAWFRGRPPQSPGSN